MAAHIDELINPALGNIVWGIIWGAEAVLLLAGRKWLETRK